jgi:hypothetical protein
MSLQTPNGIQVRFDQDRVGPCLKMLKDGGHLDKILMDLELWENMPNAFSNVLAISAALISKAAVPIVIFSLAGYALGTLVKVSTYSRFLKRLMPQILGSPIISILAAVCAGLYLSHDKAIVPIIVMMLVVTNNGLGPFNLFEVLTAPVRLLFYKHYARRTTFPYTHVERTFVAVCDHKAKELGVTIPWQDKAIGNGGA